MDEDMKEIKLIPLEKVIEAWESLEGGTSYSPSTIGCWLADDMKPAIDNARKVIKHEKDKV